MMKNQQQMAGIEADEGGGRGLFKNCTNYVLTNG